MFDFNLIQRGTLEYLEKTSLRQVDSPVKMVLSTRQDGLSGSRGGGGGTAIYGPSRYVPL